MPPEGIRFGRSDEGGLLPEPWETLTYFNPIFYVVDATRYGYTGLQDTSAWAALTVATPVAVGVFLLAVTLLRRGWRLKA